MQSLQTTETGVSRPALKALFLASQDVKQSSRDLYDRTIKPFFTWIDKVELPLTEVNRVELLKYKQFLLDKGLSPLTIGGYLTAVRKFFEWAEANKYYPNVAKGIKSPKRTQQFKKQALSNDVSKELLTYFQGRALRDYAVVNLLIRTGLRTIEASRADIEDIVFKAGKRVLLVHGKGRDSKDSFVVLTDKAYLPIANYLTTRKRAKDKDPLFISTSNNSKGQRLTTRTISSIVKEGLRAIGVDSKEYTAHSLRHTTAINILKAGGSLSDAQDVLRHQSPNTTQIYTDAIKEEIRLQRAPEELIDTMF